MQTLPPGQVDDRRRGGGQEDRRRGRQEDRRRRTGEEQEDDRRRGGGEEEDRKTGGEEEASIINLFGLELNLPDMNVCVLESLHVSTTSLLVTNCSSCISVSLVSPCLTPTDPFWS